MSEELASIRLKRSDESGRLCECCWGSCWSPQPPIDGVAQPDRCDCCFYLEQWQRLATELTKIHEMIIKSQALSADLYVYRLALLDKQTVLMKNPQIFLNATAKEGALVENKKCQKIIRELALKSSDNQELFLQLAETIRLSFGNSIVFPSDCCPTGGCC